MVSPSRARHAGIVIFLTVLSATCGAAEPLTNRVPLTGLSGAAGSETFYTFTVPVGQDKLEFRTFGGTGDCDLYVRKGVPPTIDAFDYRSWMDGNDEKITVTNPADGTWHIMLRGFSSYAGLSLLATCGAAGSTARILTITATDGGTVLTPGEGQFAIEDGTTLTLQTASADAEHVFVTWTGTAVNNGKVEDPNAASTTVLVDGDYTLQAVFQERPERPVLGFSLGEVDAEDPQEYDYRVTTNNTPETTFVERVIDVIPDPEGMIRMRPLDQTPAEAKARFGRCAAERVLVRFEYLFETPDATEIVVYLSDVPELLERGDPLRPRHHAEIGRVYAPPAGRPGSFGSGRFGVFEQWAFVEGLDLSDGTWVQLEIAGGRPYMATQADIGLASTDAGGSVLIDGWAVEVHCSGYCLDLNFTKTVDSDDLLLLMAACGSTAELDECSEDSRYCLDGAFSSDGYVDTYDIYSLIWALSDLSRVNCGSLCRVPLPLIDSAVAASGYAAAWSRPSLSAASSSSWPSGLMVLYKGMSADSLCLFDRDGAYMTDVTMPGLPAESSTQIIRGVADDLYVISTEDGVLRMEEPISSVIPPGQVSYGAATVYIGIQGDGPSCFGRPILDVAFDSEGYAYVVPVVVKPAGEAVYVSAARLELLAGQNPPYRIVKLYHDLPPWNDNLEADHLREIEVDNAGNLYVVNVHRLNESCMLWKYAPDGTVLKQVSLLDPNSPAQIANPIALHVSHDGQTLYLARGQQDRTDPSGGMLYGLSTQDLSPVRTVMIEGMPVLTSITEDPATGTLWATGFRTIEEPAALPWLPPRFTYTPLLAKIPVDASLAEAGPGSSGLAVPVSIVWTGAD